MNQVAPPCHLTQDVCVSCLELINSATSLAVGGETRRRQLQDVTPVQLTAATDSLCPNSAAGYNETDPVLPTATPPASTPPDAVDDLYLCTFNAPCVVDAGVGVLGNDSTPNANGSLVVVGVSRPPAQGNVTVAGNGGFTYTPPTGFYGTVTFDYEVSDRVDPVNVTATGECAASRWAVGGPCRRLLWQVLHSDDTALPLGGEYVAGALMAGAAAIGGGTACLQRASLPLPQSGSHTLAAP